MTEEKQGGGFGWFLLGLGVGAAVGVLYAPKVGSEMRDDLLEQARGGGEYIKHKSRVAADQVNDLVDVGKDHVSDYVDRGKQVVERGRSQWEEVVGRGRQVVNEQAGKVSAAVDAGKSAYQATTAKNETV